MTLSLNNPSLLIERAFIGGEWVGAQTGATLDVDNPATGAIIGTVPDCGEADTQAAVDAAHAAWPAWRAKTAGERAAVLERWHALVMDNLADLGRIMTAEQGKPTAEAEGEIRYAASFIKWFAEEGRRIDGSIIPAPEANRRILVMKEPVGVSAAITPWNFPAAMITRKCAPALAAGCPVVVKPSELTPFTALALIKLAEEAGFPKGVINIVTGQAAPIGKILTGSETVRKLSFTGSTAVGALLMRQSADTIKRLSLELGGNAPLIVFDDADLDLAVAATMASKFRNAGQTCVCANRILVQDGVYEAFAEKLAKAVSALKVAPGDQDGSTIGPLINRAAAEKVEAHVEDALAHGATIFARAPQGASGERFATPVILTGATRDMRLAREETFGPVAPLFRFDDEEEGIALANDTSFGLASYFYTENLHRAFRVGERLEAGMVVLNTGGIAMEMAPFGGIKQSGLGREGAHAGIEEYLETKAFHIGGLKL
ncbi:MULTISPECIES: NAD-dependent succinate-semialdehyde dehydrogenase [unclassified Sphingobium]|uniref:NAD-dependent succinate-semialdehyde dehydrogenase n=1 Tax=unclassified Sphingobium TaxID=2611147 RepID=UPI0007700516|nr:MULTISPECIES: NAD-dependent succinate-semialdehyde dehydrogenase [unclassified Sphingobium]AMK23866.1 succinate semialdehyde dehydrogenase [Sphingobium sp. TKS]NML89360.1 NAD-dependent succinate-semialdehyde dehydrogenase [Sphingobium sp. TB-6]